VSRRRKEGHRYAQRLNPLPTAHICPTCNRGFAIASNLKRHQRLHLAQLIDPMGVAGSKIKIRAMNEAIAASAAAQIAPDVTAVASTAPNHPFGAPLADPSVRQFDEVGRSTPRQSPPQLHMKDSSLLHVAAGLV
jgi:hypothetical protein